MRERIDTHSKGCGRGGTPACRNKRPEIDLAENSRRRCGSDLEYCQRAIPAVHDGRNVRRKLIINGHAGWLIEAGSNLRAQNWGSPGQVREVYRIRRLFRHDGDSQSRINGNRARNTSAR